MVIVKKQGKWKKVLCLIVIRTVEKGRNVIGDITKMTNEDKEVVTGNATCEFQDCDGTRKVVEDAYSYHSMYVCNEVRNYFIHFRNCLVRSHPRVAEESG